MPATRSSGTVEHCSKCKQTKPRDAFGTRTDWCKACRAEYNREWRKANADRHSASRKAWNAANRELKTEINRAWRYGFSGVDALRLFIACNPDCAICGNPGEHIDHCHTTGKVRGHLCNHCNKALGHMRDDPNRLIKAAEYLRQHQ